MVDISYINPHNLTLNQSLNSVGNSTGTFLSNFPYQNFFNLFFLPLILCLVMFLIIKYKEEIKKWYQIKKGNFGYVIILYIGTNRRIKEKMIKVDEFNNFKVGNKKRYSLEKMQHFAIGYKNNIPVFLYESNFILPLVLKKQKVNDEIKKAYANANIEITDNEINAISIKLEPDILELVYSKKLISDLYSIVRDDKMQKFLIWVLIACAVLGLLYYTGMLNVILSTFGIHIKPVVANTTISQSSTIVNNTLPPSKIIYS